MAYLAAAAVLVGLIATVNLLLTIGVVRRLREHTTELAELRSRSGTGGGVSGMPVALPIDARVGEFTATTVDERSVRLAELGERPLVGFFSPGCQPCKDRLPGFLKYAATRAGGRENVLAVVAGTPQETAETVEQLRRVATVVVEPDQGPVQKAFGVKGFPAFLLVEKGVVAASDFELGTVTGRDSTPLVSI
ncbi:TlpA disulfide reductase family protein [Micromonospora echinospora]|uniref:TlpA disulfide reductase family protein n=1 Tax=Micromonospora echinospora TaxID=1877 RepID=UPI003A87A5EA